MRRWLALATFVAMAGAVLYINQRRQQTTHVGPEAVLAVAAEAQHELSRVPARITRLSDADETRIGNDIAERYSYRARAVDENDAQVEHYVSEVGSQVAAHARRKLQYSFHYLPDGNFVNAFALPGGHVFIGKGLMKLMDSEDELASVLGHEIEHVEHYHCNEKAQLEAIQRNLPLGPCPWNCLKRATAKTRNWKPIVTVLNWRCWLVIHRRAQSICSRRLQSWNVNT
jgi:predicted Zn-dependent protease